MSNAEQALIRELADTAAKAIALRVVASLQEITQTLSGDDSGLTNAWEEVCVQVQGEESVDWETYREIMSDFVMEELAALPRRDRAALWLQTDDGSSWYSDNDGRGQYFMDENRSTDAGENAQPEIAVQNIFDELSAANDFDKVQVELFGDEPEELSLQNGLTKLQVSPQQSPAALSTAGDSAASEMMSLADIAKGLNAIFKPKAGGLKNIVAGEASGGEKTGSEMLVREEGRGQLSMDDTINGGTENVCGDDPAEALDAAYVPYDLLAIVEYIVEQHLLSMAETFSNRNIAAYLRGESSDENEDDEDAEMRERLIDLMPRDSMIMDLWDWDIHFEESSFDDIEDAAFADDDELIQNAESLAIDFLQWIDEYGIDYDQQGWSSPEDFSEWIGQQCLDFMKKWRANVEGEFGR